MKSSVWSGGCGFNNTSTSGWNGDVCGFTSTLLLSVELGLVALLALEGVELLVAERAAVRVVRGEVDRLQVQLRLRLVLERNK